VTVESTSLRHLLARLRLVEARVRTAVERRRAVDPNPDDPYRGLYIADDDVDRLLGHGPGKSVPADVALPPPGQRESVAADSGDATGRLRTLERTFGLDSLDVELLLVALAPDLDARFERLYGYLQDDVTRRRASAGLALELAGASPLQVEARRRLAAGAPLVDGGLVVVEDDDRPFLTRALRVPDRVTMHLLGGDTPDPSVESLLAAPPQWHGDPPTALARALAASARLVYLRERTAAIGAPFAAAAFRELGRGVIAVDLTRLTARDDPALVARLALREARLADAGLAIGPIESLLALDPGAVRTFAELEWPTVLTGAPAWDPIWSTAVPLVLELGAVPAAVRAATWRATVDGDAPPGLDPASVTSQFLLGPVQVARAATAARLAAGLEGRPLEAEDLRAGARAQSSSGLERLARRIAPRAGWADLVLPDEVVAHLRELAARGEHRELVFEEWRMAGSSARGRGVKALFAGESGTGKTLAAEVLAHELGLDLYSIDLATVVDKYVGETEKNLDRIFGEAESVHGVLFFDEADALFGKRSEVRDAHDRYANVEVAYLLQRMEAFDGIAILATNLRANIDDAFARRLDAAVDFPMPDEEHRRRLWDLCLGPNVPRAPDLDLEFCARAFELSGGNIRSVALGAAYLAAAREGAVGMADLIHSTRREYRKLGRLLDASEFGPYHELAGAP
jgi:hypothetical protein